MLTSYDVAGLYTINPDGTLKWEYNAETRDVGKVIR